MFLQQCCRLILIVKNKKALQYLIDEQNGLCAYCQKEITVKNASMEHVIPYSQNQLISTLYHNLVAVCQNFTRDDKNRKHCDKSRGNTLLPFLIFHKDFTAPDGECSFYFDTEDNGLIKARMYDHTKMDWNIHMQVIAFIEILNLNHSSIKKKRSDMLRDWEVDIYDKPDRLIKRFWMDKYDEYRNDFFAPFRQFFLIHIKNKLK